MSHFAKVEDGIVTEILVADQDFIDNNCTGTWIQTSYNTRGNVHYAPNSNTPDGGVALRGNYAGIGHTYDSTNDVFYAPKPSKSWILNKSTWSWEAPVSYPNDNDNMYIWDEDVYQADNTKGWVVFNGTKGE